jgi:hypothetical protein
MPTVRLIVLLLAVLTLTACASTRTRTDPNYTAYLQAATADAQRDALARGSIADAAAACNGDNTCVVAVAGFAALAVQGSAGRSASLQPYRRQFHPAWSIISATLPVAIQSAVAWRSSDNSRDIALGQYQMLGGIVGSVVNSPALTPRDPSITVGGDYITGRVGDDVGRDQIGGDQHIGDTVGRDQIAGGQHIGDAIGGDNNAGNSGRINSPGPFEIGPTCTGTRCQGDGDILPPPRDADNGPAPDPGD